MAGRASWHRLAEEDLTGIYLRIGVDSPVAAEYLLDALEHAIELLLSNPGAGRQWELRSPLAGGIRSWVVRGFENYLLFYRAVPDGIEVVRLIHGARDIPNLLDDEP